MACDEPGIISIVICPGWVKTDMGGNNASLTIDESTEAIIKTIIKIKIEDSGKFLSTNGEYTF